uniref:RRM domain-containing protein n=1 Tax=Ornithorhynchus anatinus TaxID=9258 RepID=A0A6I8NNC2_ORNAN
DSPGRRWVVGPKGCHFGLPKSCVRPRLPWISEIKEHFSQFGHIRRCLLPFDKETGFHRGFCWVGFSSEEELQNALQHESHLIDGVKLYVQRQQYRKAFSNPPKKDQGDY